MFLGPSLPEDIWHHIHSLMPMGDAARAASVSRTFLRSWRCHPILTFSDKSLGLNKIVYGKEESLCLNKIVCGKDWAASVFSSKVSHILARHSGIGLKTLQIDIPYYFGTANYCFLDNWLQTALTSGIEELTLFFRTWKEKYNFPYSFLSNKSGDSIRYIHLHNCSFHPAATLGSLRSLTRLHLSSVDITGEEMECLLCNSVVLERLEVEYCHRIVCLKVPCILQRLSYLEVRGGNKLEAIDNEAPNLSGFVFGGYNKVRLSLGETLQTKRLTVRCGPLMPNLEALAPRSGIETATPMPHSKFLHLRHLSTALYGSYIWPTYDYLSLANFLDAAPSLEIFQLEVVQDRMKQVSIFADSSNLWQMEEHQYHSLKSVTIKGFCHAKSLVKLTLQIVERATSLECLTLEAHQRTVRCPAHRNKSDKCCPMPKDILMDAYRGISAVRTYIEPKVPSTVKLHVVDLCSCHDDRLFR